MLLVAALLLLVLSAPLVLAIVRANELFLLRVRSGRIEIARGKIPPKLLSDLEEIVKRVEHANLRGVTEGGRPRLYAEGILDDNQKQRLRNVLGMWTTAQIRTAPRTSSRRS